MEFRNDVIGVVSLWRQNDDEFISNVALTETVKNCSILRDIRIDKDIEKKKRNGRTGTEVRIVRCVGRYRLRRPIYMQHE